MGQDTGLRARRGWLGGVAGSEAIWVGFEVMGEIRILRVEYGLDHLSRFSECFYTNRDRLDLMLKIQVMTTVPLPAFPLNRLTPTPATEEGQDSDEPKIELQGLVFVAKIPTQNQPKVEDEPDLQKNDDEPLESVRAILVYSEEGR